MNVLVIPEDFRKDQYILGPIIRAMFSKIGRPANVEVLKDPLLGGVSEALKIENLRGIFDRNKYYVDLFLLCVDRDLEEGRRASLNNLENQLRPELPAGKFFLAENGWQELEVWVLAGHDLPPDWTWGDIRQERDPKERFFDVMAGNRGLLNEPGGGRKTLSLEAARRYRRIFSRCGQDIQNLEGRIVTWIETL